MPIVRMNFNILLIILIYMQNKHERSIFKKKNQHALLHSTNLTFKNLTNYLIYEIVNRQLDNL